LQGKSLYITAIEPPVELAENIRILQRAFADNYGFPVALRPPVHITFTPPVHLNDAELNRYTNRLSETAQQTRQFEVVLEGFGFFHQARVVYIRVNQQPHLEEMHQLFTAGLAGDFRQVYRPHITIGYRNIDVETFKKIMEDYTGRLYSGSFVVDNVRLWKHEAGYWNTIAQMNLLS